MKKQLLLLVSLLLPLASSCDNNQPTNSEDKPNSISQTTYVESNDYSTLDTSYNYYADSSPYEYIEDFFYHDSYYIYELSDENTNYYSCFYVHEDDLNFIKEYESQSPLNLPPFLGEGHDLNYVRYFSGIDYGFYNYTLYKSSSIPNQSNYAFHDFKIFEIDKDEQIPLEIEDYKLVLISSKIFYNIYDLDNNYLGKVDVLVEQTSHEHYALSKQFNNQIIDIEEKLIINSDISYADRIIRYPELMNPNGFKIYKIDNLEYIKTFDTCLDEYKEDLKNMFEYTYDESGYYFKLSDIISFINSKKQII